MNNSIIDLFTTKEFKMLYFLESKQIITADGIRILHSQDDIAKEFGVSIATANKLITSLISIGCLEKYRQKSGYIITSKGELLLSQIKAINI